MTRPSAEHDPRHRESTRHRLVRILLAEGVRDIEEWKLADPELAAAKGYPREYPAELIDDYGTVFVDVTIDAHTGSPVCHEVNGPNAVGSDALTGESSLRADLEARQALRRAREMGYLAAEGTLNAPVATVHAHQHWSSFRTGGEFYPRVEDFFDLLGERLPNSEVAMRGAHESLGTEAVAVVMGDVPSVAEHLSVDPVSRRFEYRGRPVIFAGNPNLLPELVRTGKLAPGPSADQADLRVFHAWRLADLVHDKARQQLLFQGTGVRPLGYFTADSADEALARTRRLLEHGPVVLKPNGTSGGCGIHVVVPQMSDDEIRARAERVVGDCVAKYGENAEASALPLRGFEFVRSTGYPMADGDHLWDLRIALLFEPGRAFVYPVTLRLTPKPFREDEFFDDRDQWISNVTGRQETFLRSGLDDAVLAAVGMTETRLEQIFDASLRWTLRAWDLSVRGGPYAVAVYEDECEAEDGLFYPREKFSA